MEILLSESDFKFDISNTILKTSFEIDISF